jgi:hypothetical protein
VLLALISSSGGAPSSEVVKEFLRECYGNIVSDGILCPGLLLRCCLRCVRTDLLSVGYGFFSFVVFAVLVLIPLGLVPTGYGSTEAGAITNDSGNLQGGIQFKLRDLPELGYLSMRVSSRSSSLNHWS